MVQNSFQVSEASQFLRLATGCAGQYSQSLDKFCKPFPSSESIHFRNGPYDALKMLIAISVGLEIWSDVRCGG